MPPAPRRAGRVVAAGFDDPPPDDAARAKLRKEALEWLKAEYSAWSNLLESDVPKSPALVAKTLAHWKEDADLSGIREEKEMAKLPESGTLGIQAILVRRRPPTDQGKKRQIERRNIRSPSSWPRPRIAGGVLEESATQARGGLPRLFFRRPVAVRGQTSHGRVGTGGRHRGGS